MDNSVLKTKHMVLQEAYRPANVVVRSCMMGMVAFALGLFWLSLRVMYFLMTY